MEPWGAGSGKRDAASVNEHAQAATARTVSRPATPAPTLATLLTTERHLKAIGVSARLKQPPGDDRRIVRLDQQIDTALATSFSALFSTELLRSVPDDLPLTPMRRGRESLGGASRIPACAPARNRGVEHVCGRTGTGWHRQLDPKSSAARRSISSRETSSMRWLSIHCWPNGSRRRPPRSPQNRSSSG
jgi:hypothetical protein